jgi:hypothetical protein
MVEHASMALTATIAHAKQASQDRIVSTKSTSVIRHRAKMAPRVMNKITTTNAIALMAFEESNVKNMSTGVRKIRAIMEQLVVKRRTISLVNVLLDGLEKCAMSRWSHAKMQH